MKKNLTIAIVIFISMSILGSFATALASEEKTGTLTVTINGFPDSNGAAMVALSDSAANFAGKAKNAFERKMSKVENNSATVVFENIPYGDYAISMYHDQNSNNKMDKNSMGMPREAYGFSNNAKGLFGKPPWDKVRFKLDEAEKLHTISLE